MNRLSSSVFILAIGFFIVALSGCKTNSQIQCPDFASARKTHLPIIAMGHGYRGKSSKPATPIANVQVSQATATATASTDQGMHFKLRMPNALTQQLQSDQELADMNKVLADYSNSKVTLQRNDQGKLFLKAHSVKDIFALTKNTSHPRGYYERRYGNGGGGGDASGAAIASGVLGPISFVFAFLPFLSLAAIPISIAAIITGAIGLRSHRQRIAAVGLTFGILGLILSILFSWLYFAFWAFFFI